MNISPKSDRVFIRRDMKDAMTASGIVLPMQVGKLREDTGVVVAVGPGRLTEHGFRLMPEVEAGEKVLFREMTAVEVEVNGEKLAMVREPDILAVIES